MLLVKGNLETSFSRKKGPFRAILGYPSWGYDLRGTTPDKKKTARLYPKGPKHPNTKAGTWM